MSGVREPRAIAVLGTAIGIWRMSLVMGALLSIFAACAAAPRAAAPVWATEAGRRQAFPPEEYLAQPGAGPTEEEARAEASAALSRFVRMEVESRSQASSLMESRPEGGTVRAAAIAGQVSVSSAAALYQVEFTEPWHDVSRGQYVCVAYICRQQAWGYVRPRLAAVADGFARGVALARNEEEPFRRVLALGAARAPLEEWYVLYDFARLVAPAEAAAFQETEALDRQAAAELAALRQHVIISVEAVGEGGGRIAAAVSRLLDGAGFGVSARGADYHAVVSVSMREEQAPSAYVCRPDVNVVIAGPSGTVYAFAAAPGKCAAYDRSGAIARAYASLERALDGGFLRDAR